ncbi:MAG: hypothetical protein KF701_09720 [Anaerolineales bacterium]|nr:MAG: hypothetical protein KF701_09720 [Anaerolineales bacterium]
MSKGRVFLFLWSQAEAEAAARLISGWGWQVDTEWQDGGRGSAAVKASPPDAVVLYLDHKPSHSRVTAEHLAQTKATAHIPLLFVGGEGEGLAKTQAKLPGATYTSEAGLQAALEALR